MKIDAFPGVPNSPIKFMPIFAKERFGDSTSVCGILRSIFPLTTANLPLDPHSDASLGKIKGGQSVSSFC